MFVIVTGTIVKLFATKMTPIGGVVVELESSLYDTCNTGYCCAVIFMTGRYFFGASIMIHGV